MKTAKIDKAKKTLSEICDRLNAGHIEVLENWDFAKVTFDNYADYTDNSYALWLVNFPITQFPSELTFYVQLV